MTNISYKTLRQVTFSIYILITVLFCLILFHLGKREIDRARNFADREKKYFEELLRCRTTLGEVEREYRELLQSPSPASAAAFKDKIWLLRKSFNQLVKNERSRSVSSAFSAENLLDDACLLASLSTAVSHDLMEHPLDRNFLLVEDGQAIENVLLSLQQKTHRLLSEELDHVGIWQRQSVFFFSRLQYLSILFFVLTTVFSVAASYLFSYILRRALWGLSEGTRELSSGNLKYRFHNIQRDEIGNVMYDFNMMALRLERQTNALHKANKELRHKTEALIEAHQHKDRFIANMSHELRTPLNSVIGFAELMIQRAEKKDSESIRKHSKRILSAAEHLLDLISDLLEVAKVDAGVLKPVFSGFNLADSIDETEKMLRPLAEKKSLIFKVESPREMPICGDKRLIKQILINLINNAVKFTHQGEISVQATKIEQSYQVTVKDTGIGMSDDDQKYIFKDFHRVETGLTSNYEGVGLGLTLSKRLVELHGGSITVSSKPKEGSSFTFNLPIDRENSS